MFGHLNVTFAPILNPCFYFPLILINIIANYIVFIVYLFI